MKNELIMPEYNASVENIHIVDSCKIPKKHFGYILNKIKDDNPLCLVPKYRTLHSLKMEWACHNFLYNIGYERKRTSNVDLNWPMKWYIELVYNIFGLFVWLFIK